MKTYHHLSERSRPKYFLSISFLWVFLFTLDAKVAFAQRGEFDTGQGRDGSGPANVVMIFYSVWGNHTLSTNNNGFVFVQTENQFSSAFGWNYWGRPLYSKTHGDGSIRNNYKMYLGNSKDTPHNDLLDYHAELLTAAAVDVVVLDLTNGVQQDIVDGAFALCKRYVERNAAGLPTPKVVPWIQDEGSLASVKQQIFDQFPSDVFFQYLGKNLVLLGNNNSLSAIPTGGLCDTYTCRRMWGLNNTGSIWQFKVNDLPPPPPFVFNGQPEQMCAPIATQATFMYQNGSVVPTAQGRNGGSYFNAYMNAAIQTQPNFLFIMAWNEWAAQNQGTSENPSFVDIWKEEYNADIEPVFGFHGWQYYILMRDNISRFKGGRYNSFGASRSLVREAEAFSTQSGTNSSDCSDVAGGRCITGISEGDVIVYDDVNFISPGPKTFSYRVASSTGGRFRLTGPGGSPVYGEYNVPTTGGEQIWVTIYLNYNDIPTGNQTLEIRGIVGNFNLNNFAVSPSTLPLSTTRVSRTASEATTPNKKEAPSNFLNTSPNPFTQGVTFSTPKDSKQVQVQIYDFSGKLVSTLYDDDLKESESIYWNGKNEAGNYLTPGVYYYKIRSGQAVYSGKLFKE